MKERIDLSKFPKSQWIEDAKRRERNWWWSQYWLRIHLKYLRIKRFIKRLMI